MLAAHVSVTEQITRNELKQSRPSVTSRPPSSAARLPIFALDGIGKSPADHAPHVSATLPGSVAVDSSSKPAESLITSVPGRCGLVDTPTSKRKEVEDPPSSRKKRRVSPLSRAQAAEKYDQINAEARLVSEHNALVDTAVSGLVTALGSVHPHYIHHKAFWSGLVYQNVASMIGKLEPLRKVAAINEGVLVDLEADDVVDDE